MADQKLVTHYDNLRVANNAPTAVIRAAYRALVQQFHPDKFPDQTLAEHRIKIINKAYEVLSDAEKRRAHDAWIAEQKARPGIEASARADAGRLYQTGDAQTRSAASTASLARPQASSRVPWMRLGRTIERLALLGGVSLLAYVFLFEKPNPAPVPAAKEKAGKTLSSALPPPVKAAGLNGTIFEDAARCFWVYAPIAQVGREFPHRALFLFGQERIRWFESFLKTQGDNPSLTQAIESGEQRYKDSSIGFQNALRVALADNDHTMFASAVDAAVACDRRLGIRTKLVPRL